MITNAPSSDLKPGMSNAEVLIVVFSLVALVGGLFCAAVYWKRGSDRSAAIMNIRNCQQAMRGHSGMRQVEIGGPFTKRDLEQYMTFPSSVSALEGTIEFAPGTINTPVGELWLQMQAPHTENYIGRYGFEHVSDYEDW